jgi:light-regulated signal transduction histidine kinase (bacteriophytochrome)
MGNRGCGAVLSLADIFVASLHDLKGPTSRLRVLAELVGDRIQIDDPDTRRLLRHITESADALDRVVEALRRYSEICARPRRVRHFQLAGAVSAAIGNLHEKVQATGASISHQGLPAVRADFDQMAWLFEELITNSIRFRSAEPPRIEISASTRPGRAPVVSVIDNGSGIEDRFAERVFLPFQRISSLGGPGLGLTMCRTIVELNGGRMWVESRVRGTELRFTTQEEAGRGGAPAVERPLRPARRR